MSGRAGAIALAALAMLARPAAPREVPADRSVPPPFDAVGTFRPPRCEVRRLANGLRLLVVPRPAVPSVHLVWAVGAGSAGDPDRLPGLAALLADALVHEPRGAGRSLAETLDDRGVLLDVDVDRDSMRFSFQAPADRLGWALRRLERSLLREPYGLETARAQALDELARAAEDPEGLLLDAAWRAAYGPAHPYGHTVRGTPDSVNAIGLSELRRFHRLWFHPDGMLVVVAGDVDPRALSRRLGRLRAPRAVQPPPPCGGRVRAAERAGVRRVVLIDRPRSSRSTIGLALPLPPDLDPLDPAALVTNQLLGGPGYSRLLGALRNETGYAYDARSGVHFRRLGGLFLAHATVDAENTIPALRRLALEVEALRRRPPPEELARASAFVRHGLVAGWFETNRSTARTWTRLALLGLDQPGIDERLRGISAVQVDDAARFAGEHLEPGRLVLLVVGDAATLDGPLREAGLGSLESWGSSREAAAPAQTRPGAGPGADVPRED